MKRIPARWLALAALALALLWIFSCSDDDCPTCPKPVCHDPAQAFLGKWVVFESYINGSPDNLFLDMQWDFINHDTVVVTDPEPSDTSILYVWSVNDSMFFMMSGVDPITEFYGFTYEFEADTLDLTGKTGMPFSVYWRFRKTS